MKTILENAVAVLKAEAQRIEITIQHLTGIIGGTTTAISALPIKTKRVINPRLAKPAEAISGLKGKRKYTRRGIVSADGTTTTPTTDTAAGAPQTFAGAVKRVVRDSKSPLTVAAIFAAIETRWPSLAEGKDGGNVMANLSYASSQGKCEKIGIGAMATFKALDASYFQETE